MGAATSAWLRIFPELRLAPRTDAPVHPQPHAPVQRADDTPTLRAGEPLRVSVRRDVGILLARSPAMVIDLLFALSATVAIVAYARGVPAELAVPAAVSHG